jgi:zinc and cadmium transporter
MLFLVSTRWRLGPDGRFHLDRARAVTHAPGTLLSIVIASLAGGVLSTLVAAATLRLSAHWVPRLVSFAVGALLGAVFLDLLPEALENGSPRSVMITVLAGLLGFFLLEKLVLWRHSHGHETHVPDAEESEHDHALHGRGYSGSRPGLMILIGNGVHSFCDGIVIAAAFLADTALGVATTIAIVAHAVPQQVGDFAVLLHSGFTKRKAFTFNVAVGFATLAGALAAYGALSDMRQTLPLALSFAGASLLYVAVADLIPSLHRRPEPVETARQMLAIGLGLAVIAVALLVFEG